MNDELIKAITSIDNINRNKFLKEKYIKDKKSDGNEIFDSMLKEEMERLKKEKEDLKDKKQYISILNELYLKERSKHHL